MSHALTTKRGDAEKLVVMAAERAGRIGRRIRERRDELDLTQAQIAERMGEESVTGTYVSRWERGEHEPLGDRLDKLAGILDTTAADLMAGALAERKKKGGTPDLGATLNGSVPDELRDRLTGLDERLDRILAAVEKLVPAVAELQGRIGALAKAQEQSQATRSKPRKRRSS